MADFTGWLLAEYRIADSDSNANWLVGQSCPSCTALLPYRSVDDAVANLVADAHLAALAVEHGCRLCSSDADCRLFPSLAWHNPLEDD
jgi:hypothetical protein